MEVFIKIVTISLICGVSRPHQTPRLAAAATVGGAPSALGCRALYIKVRVNPLDARHLIRYIGRPYFDRYNFQLINSRLTCSIIASFRFNQIKRWRPSLIPKKKKKKKNGDSPFNPLVRLRKLSVYALSITCRKN